MKIMIVEDNPNMRQMIKNVIQKNTIQVEAILECEAGEDAIEKYDNFLPDWVLMDIQLNVMNGLAAAEIIIQNNSQARIIIVTQYNEAVYKNKAKAIGVYGYVLKDNLHELVQILNKLSVLRK